MERGEKRREERREEGERVWYGEGGEVCTVSGEKKKMKWVWSVDSKFLKKEKWSVVHVYVSNKRERETCILCLIYIYIYICVCVCVFKSVSVFIGWKKEERGI
jgi:hypothetical protein